MLDPLFHQPARTRIAAFLAAREWASFSELKRTTGLTDGNLDAHLRKLTEAGYVGSSELTDGGRPQTAFSLTETGRKVFVDYVESLRELLGLAAFSAPPRRPPKGRKKT